MRLDELPLRRSATVAAIDWQALAPHDERRLREFGLDDGGAIEALHVGLFGRDPIACRIGRMTIALRRVVARAVTVEAVPR